MLMEIVSSDMSMSKSYNHTNSERFSFIFPREIIFYICHLFRNSTEMICKNNCTFHFSLCIFFTKTLFIKRVLNKVGMIGTLFNAVRK